MQYTEFIHPEDAAALKALKAIPMLSTIIKKVMDVGIEQLQTGLNMASKVKLTPTQLPRLHNILPPICERLEIKEPEFYLEMNPMPNAYAFGDTQTAITITSALVDMMSEEELVGVVAHECGHIACRHMLYHTLAQVIANASGMFETLSKLAIPIHYALMYWQRKSELSCDRAAAYIVGPQTTASMLARLAGGPKSITSELKSSLPIGLRQFESFDFEHYSDICAYLPIKDQKESVNLGKQEITCSTSNSQRDLSKHKGGLITITIAFLLCVVYMLNYYTELSNIYSLTTNGIFGESEASYIIKFDCNDNYDIRIEAKIQNPKNNNLIFFSMLLNKKHIEGIVNNENGKTIGYIDAEFSISENLFEIKGESDIQENGDYKTIPIKVNGVLPTHIINKIIQSNSTYFE